MSVPETRIHGIDYKCIYAITYKRRVNFIYKEIYHDDMALRGKKSISSYRDIFKIIIYTEKHLARDSNS